MVYYHPTGLFTGATTSGYWFSDTAVSIWQADDVRAPILTLIILTLYAIHVGNLGMTTLFNLTTLLIGMRFLILYFQALGGLAATGFGLIISGALIMSLGWAWQRYRTHLQQWTQGLDN